MLLTGAWRQPCSLRPARQTSWARYWLSCPGDWWTQSQPEAPSQTTHALFDLIPWFLLLRLAQKPACEPLNRTLKGPIVHIMQPCVLVNTVQCTRSTQSAARTGWTRPQL